MNWAQKIAIKKLLATGLTKQADPETIRKLRDLKEQIKSEKDGLNGFGIHISPEMQQILDSIPDEEPSQDIPQSAEITTPQE